jgi:hypothetical protein
MDIFRIFRTYKKFKYKIRTNKILVDFKMPKLKIIVLIVVPIVNRETHNL